MDLLRRRHFELSDLEIPCDVVTNQGHTSVTLVAYGDDRRQDMWAARSEHVQLRIPVVECVQRFVEINQPVYRSIYNRTGQPDGNLLFVVAPQNSARCRRIQFEHGA